MIRQISAVKHLPQAHQLAYDHWLEVAKDTGVPEPDINPELVKAMEDAGLLLTLGAFKDEELIGYSINVLGPTFNFQHLKVCQNEGIFVAKPYRGTIGALLVKETLTAAQAKGAARVLFHAYIGTSADALFSRLRWQGRPFQAFDITYTMEISPCLPESA